MTTPSKILLIESSDGNRARQLREKLEGAGYSVRIAYGYQGAMRVLSMRFHLIAIPVDFFDHERHIEDCLALYRNLWGDFGNHCVRVVGDPARVDERLEVRLTECGLRLFDINNLSPAQLEAPSAP